MFKTVHSFEDRCRCCREISERYPERIPVILERFPGNKHGPALTKKKFLVPRDAEVGRFIVEVRRLLPQLAGTDALYFYIDATLMPVSALMGQVYEQHHDEDGFLYVQYTLENTFGQ